MPVPTTDESLWRDYRTRLVRFVAKRVADHATAEDIVHDVLVRAHMKGGGVRDGDRFEAWLYRVTRNAIIDHYRARRPAEELPADLAADGEAERDVRHELAQCLTPLVNTLPDHYRAAVVLSELDGRTQQETADLLGLSLSGAKSRVQRARRMLEEKLLACCRVELGARGDIVDFESRAGCGPREDGCGGC